MNNQRSKEQELLFTLGSLPRNMVSHHGTENLTEFVLHGICQEGFGISKAAYFINNPDFDFLKGVAGYNDEESYKAKDTCWNEKDAFTSCMLSSNFNQQVRQMHDKSFSRGHQSEIEAVKKLAHVLGFKAPGHHAWDVKYDNHGLFIFEVPENPVHTQDHLYNFLHLLGFCPVF